MRADALALLHDALGWRLTRERWRGVERSLDAMAVALDGGEFALFAEAVNDLEADGPVRATRIEDVPPEPAPEPVRERISELVHSLAVPMPGEAAIQAGTDNDAAG